MSEKFSRRIKVFPVPESETVDIAFQSALAYNLIHRFYDTNTRIYRFSSKIRNAVPRRGFSIENAAGCVFMYRFSNSSCRVLWLITEIRSYLTEDRNRNINRNKIDPTYLLSAGFIFERYMYIWILFSQRKYIIISLILDEINRTIFSFFLL